MFLPAFLPFPLLSYPPFFLFFGKFIYLFIFVCLEFFWNFYWSMKYKILGLNNWRCGDIMEKL